MIFRRIVLDTNVVVSRALSPDSTSGRVFDKALRTAILLASDESFAELEEVLSRKKFDKFTQYAKRMEALRVYRQDLEICQVSEVVTDCRDPDDNKILALSGQADVIVTGDLDLLTLHPWRGISILNPSDYLAESG